MFWLLNHGDGRVVVGVVCAVDGGRDCVKQRDARDMTKSGFGRGRVLDRWIDGSACAQVKGTGRGGWQTPVQSPKLSSWIGRWKTPGLSAETQNHIEETR